MQPVPRLQEECCHFSPPSGSVSDFCYFCLRPFAGIEGGGPAHVAGEHRSDCFECKICRRVGFL